MAVVEQILFVVLFCSGALCLIISAIVLLVGFSNKSGKLKKIGYRIGIVPIVCFSLLSFYYFIVFPSIQKSEVELFSGTYVLTETSEQILPKKEPFKAHPKLVLHQDGTYKFDGVEGVRLAKRGTWKTEEEDGKWGFYDENGNLSESVGPATNGLIATFAFKYNSKQDNRVGTKSIIFVKKL